MKDDLNTLNVGDEAVIANYAGYGLPHYARCIVKRKTKTQIVIGYHHNKDIERKFRIEDGKEVGHNGIYNCERLSLINETVLAHEARRRLEYEASPKLFLLKDKLSNIRWLTDDQIHTLVNIAEELFPEKKEEQAVG